MELAKEDIQRHIRKQKTIISPHPSKIYIASLYTLLVNKTVLSCFLFWNECQRCSRFKWYMAFWPRSKCSIYSYQLNMICLWYGDYNIKLIFAKELGVAPPLPRVGLALQYLQESAQSPTRETKIQTKITLPILYSLNLLAYDFDILNECKTLKFSGWGDFSFLILHSFVNDICWYVIIFI